MAMGDTGKRVCAGSVLLTREAGKNDALQQLLAAEGIATFELPMVRTVDGRDAARLPQTLQEQAFDWVVVTSPESARVLAQAWRQCSAPPPLRIAAVGKGACTMQTLQNV